MKPIAILSLLVLAIPAVTSHAQNMDARRLADLEQDVLQLKTQMGQMSMTVEAVQRENAILRAQLGKSQQAGAAQYATLAQLDAQISTLRAELARAQREQKTEIIDEVSRQIERLAQQTQQALQAQAASIAAAPSAPTTAIMFTDNFPKTGISYTIQKGDTLSGIARRNNASINDIINANRISDPTKLMPGQVIFIPQKTQ
ncbi:MAG: LysM peptidoglycan-binding domain-containing protein [Opitutales bacterium]|nr:LysM peptidoglycan-binding domain-containing protein [Opitutales bacterium]